MGYLPIYLHGYISLLRDGVKLFPGVADAPEAFSRLFNRLGSQMNPRPSSETADCDSRRSASTALSPDRARDVLTVSSMLIASV